MVEAQSQAPRSVEDLATALGLSSSLLVRRLQPLVAAGFVERRQERTATGRVVFYLPLPAARVEWVSTAFRLSLGWTCQGEMDWSLPLLSQLADVRARETTARFINGLRSGRRLRPRAEPAHTDAFSEPAVSLIVYGSTATGLARIDSDVDVLAIAADANDEDEILDVAAEATIVSPRPLQVKVITLAGLGRLPRVIAQGIDEAGIVVFDGLRAPEVWRRAYGGRTRT